jgi:RNase H-fold protein (predicted Holliday junction resolvase)
MAARSITKFLTTPSKVAHALDWRTASGSILSVTIEKDRIDLAVASHPLLGHPVEELYVPLETETVENHKVLKSSVVEELSAIVKEFKVCGMVVNWPVQKDGWCGAPCGRVLHTLDLISAHSSLVRTPICLWDEEKNAPPEDHWGRAALYSRRTEKTFHQASKEQYEEHNKKVALNVWNDFFRSHWPDLYQEKQQQEEEMDRPLPASLSREFDACLFDSAEQNCQNQAVY